MELSVGLWIAYSIILTAYLFAIAFFYSYFFYAKNRIFTKIKYSFLAISFASTILLCFLAMGIYVVIDFCFLHYVSSSDDIINIIFCWIVVMFATFHLVYYCILPNLINKNKIEYKNFKQTDFISKLEQVKKQITNLNYLDSIIKKRHKKYYTSMVNEKERINRMLEEKNRTYSDLLASIVNFNEQFTTRWSKKYNNYQLLLCYELLIALQQKKF